MYIYIQRRKTADGSEHETRLLGITIDNVSILRDMANIVMRIEVTPENPEPVLRVVHDPNNLYPGHEITLVSAILLWVNAMADGIAQILIQTQRLNPTQMQRIMAAAFAVRKQS